MVASLRTAHDSIWCGTPGTPPDVFPDPYPPPDPEPDGPDLPEPDPDPVPYDPEPKPVPVNESVFTSVHTKESIRGLSVEKSHTSESLLYRLK